jgi:type I restriction enzyme S subunit
MGDLCEVVAGSTPKTAVPEYWNGDIPWVTPDDLSRHRAKYIDRGARFLTRAGYDSCSTKLVPEGSILYTTRAPIGYAAIAERPVCTNQGFKNFVPPSTVDSSYLYWYLLYSTPMIRGMGSGTTFKEVSKKVAQSIPVVLPRTKNEQRRIVEAIEEQFSRLDAAEELLAAATIRSERLRAAALKGWATGPLVPLGELLLEGMANGRSVPTREDGFPVLRLNALVQGRIDLRQRKGGDWDRNRAEKFLIREGDFLVARGNGSVSLVGRGGLVGESDEVAFPDTMIRVRPDPERLSASYLRLVWDSLSVRRQIESVARTTAGIYKVSQHDLQRILVPCPPSEHQSDIVAEADSFDSSVARMEGELKRTRMRCTGLRSAVLREAFAGRLVRQGASSDLSEKVGS